MVQQRSDEEAAVTVIKLAQINYVLPYCITSSCKTPEDEGTARMLHREGRRS